jgi:tRNA pseudouridine38-40 synthase
MVTVPKNHQRFLVFHQYFGSPFRGWQRAPGEYTVQGVLDEAMNAILKRDPGADFTISGSSRTDRGVHALRTTCHIDIRRDTKQTSSTLFASLNHFLRTHSIRVAYFIFSYLP